MKIFHILLGKANPNTLNGVNKVVHYLATEQQKLGNNVTVIGIANNEIKRHTPIYNYKLFRASRVPFFYNKKALKYIINNSDEESIFHFHSVFIPWFLPMIKELKTLGYKHIFLTPHGQYVNEAMNSSIKKKICFKLFDSKILSEVEAVHIIGDITENNKYINTYSSKVVCIPNGFNTDENIQDFNSNRELIFGYLGRLECKQKGLDVLLIAYKIYIENGGKGLLKIAGSGPDEIKLKKITKDLKIEKHVTFLGNLFDNDKWNFLNSCAVLLSPSRWEGIPTAALEACAISLPIIITKETNLGSYVNRYKNGIVINNLSGEELSQALSDFEKIYNNKSLYNKTCSSSRSIIDKELNWKNISVKIINELYK